MTRPRSARASSRRLNTRTHARTHASDAPAAPRAVLPRITPRDAPSWRAARISGVPSSRVYIAEAACAFCAVPARALRRRTRLAGPAAFSRACCPSERPRDRRHLPLSLAWECGTRARRRARDGMTRAQIRTYSLRVHCSCYPCIQRPCENVPWVRTHRAARIASSPKIRPSTCPAAYSRGLIIFATASGSSTDSGYGSGSGRTCSHPPSTTIT